MPLASGIGTEQAPGTPGEVTGTSTLIAATHAIESGSSGDSTYTTTDRALSFLEVARDRLANAIKTELNAAAFDGRPINPAVAAFQTTESQQLQFVADILTQG
jgi:hypothetical protein